MKVVIYARVSTKDKGQDTENQLVQLREFASKESWQIVAEFVDRETGSKSDRASPKCSLAMPKMRWTDVGHRKTHRCRNPTSFSSRHGHRGRMKRLSAATNLCVCQRAQSLRAWPSHKPSPSTFSSPVLVRILRFRHLFNSRWRLSCSAAQPWRISTPHLPSIEFA